MGKFFGSILFFLTVVILVYFLNLSQIESYAQIYVVTDPSFEAPHIIAVFELLHHPFEYFWVIPSWLIAGFLSGIITRSWKGAILVSILTGFILSLTWIFLMSRYLPNYWNNFISIYVDLSFFGQTFGTGLLLGVFSAAPAVCGAYLNASHKKIRERSPLKEIETVCPTCGTVFQSKPKICYKCNTPLDTTLDTIDQKA